MKDCLIILLAVLLALSWAGNRSGPEAQIDASAAELHHADWPVCITVRPGPLPGPQPTPSNPHPRRNDDA
jgi:hypothetical protein